MSTPGDAHTEPAQGEPGWFWHFLSTISDEARREQYWVEHAAKGLHAILGVVLFQDESTQEEIIENIEKLYADLTGNRIVHG